MLRSVLPDALGALTGSAPLTFAARLLFCSFFLLLLCSAARFVETLNFELHLHTYPYADMDWQSLAFVYSHNRAGVPGPVTRWAARRRRQHPPAAHRSAHAHRLHPPPRAPGCCRAPQRRWPATATWSWCPHTWLPGAAACARLPARRQRGVPAALPTLTGSPALPTRQLDLQPPQQRHLPGLQQAGRDTALAAGGVREWGRRARPACVPQLRSPAAHAHTPAGLRARLFAQARPRERWVLVLDPDMIVRDSFQGWGAQYGAGRQLNGREGGRLSDEALLRRSSVF